MCGRMQSAAKLATLYAGSLSCKRCAANVATCMQALTVLLGSKMPRVRSFAAEQLYASSLLWRRQRNGCNAATWTPGTVAALQDILRSQRWGSDDAGPCLEARTQMIRLLGLKAPVAKERAAKPGSAGTTTVDEHATYQGLLNDVARGL